MNRVTHERLAALAGPPPQTKPSNNGHAHKKTSSSSAFDIEGFIRRNNLDARKPEPYEGGNIYVLEKCPWNSDHNNASAFIIQYGNGAIAAGCHHDSCKGNDWPTLRAKYEPRQQNGQTKNDRPVFTAAITRAVDVVVKDIDWWWPRNIALGKLNLIAGEPGACKSTMTDDWAARTSKGIPHPDSTPCPMGSTIFWTCEDDYSDTTVPRLIAAGADLSKISFFDGAKVIDDEGNPHIVSVSLDNLAPIEDAIRQQGDVKLLVIDPVSAVSGRTDSHKNADVRGQLAPLARLVADYGVCCVMITHLNKGWNGKALHRAMGSIAYVAASRSAWLVAKDRLVDSRRFLLPMKNNLGNDTAGYAFNVVSAGPNVAKIKWESGIITMKADEAIADDPEEPREAAAREAAEAWLSELLKPHEMPSAQVRTEAKAAGMAWATVRRAQQNIGIRPFKRQFDGVWMWRLPVKQDAQDQLAHQDAQGGPS